MEINLPEDLAADDARPALMQAPENFSKAIYFFILTSFLYLQVSKKPTMSKSKNRSGDPEQLKSFSGTESQNKVQVVIETPKGSRNKYAYDPEQKMFELTRVLPAGMIFPYDFGFVPSTKADDGDALDVLILMDAPAFTGCLVEARLVGVFEGDQVQSGRKKRNDRLIAVATESQIHSHVKDLGDLNPNLVDEMAYFFENYPGKNESFKVLSRKGPKAAMQLLKKARKKKGAAH